MTRLIALLTFVAFAVGAGAQQGNLTTVIVQPADPTVSVATSCAAPCRAPATITYAVTVTDAPAGSVVDFQAGANASSLAVVGSSGTGVPVAPGATTLVYSFSWQRVPAGSYTLSALRRTATAGGNTGTPLAVIDVTEPGWVTMGMVFPQGAVMPGQAVVVQVPEASPTTEPVLARGPVQ